MRTSNVDFEAPGPGTWLRDASHWPLPVPLLYALAYPPGFEEGMASGNARYGLPARGSRIAFPNGFAYAQRVDLEDQTEILRRIAICETLWDDRPWRTDVERWEREVRPASIRRHLALVDVDIEALDDGRLAAHLAMLVHHFTAMVVQHHTFNLAVGLPMGDFVAHVQDWTGWQPGQLLSVLEGSSPISRGEYDELADVIEVLRADRSVIRLLQEASALDRVAARPDTGGAAVREYLRHVGYRLVGGFDLGCPIALELPEVLCRSLRQRLETTSRGRGESAVAERESDLRDAVPAAHRTQFDQLLEEVRATCWLRDERGLYSDVWAGGLLRSAVLKAGRRLASRGNLREPNDLLDTTPDELVALVRGNPGPGGDELADRATRRSALAHREAPPSLGPAPTESPDPAPLSAAVLRAARARLAFGTLLLDDGVAESESRVVRGIAAHPGTYEGMARVVLDPSDFVRIVDGDVLVTISTTEAFNFFVPLVGALVTDRGGAISHAAVIARECGIPAVVGCSDATARIVDGDRVLVDGTTGDVRILRPS